MDMLKIRYLTLVTITLLNTDIGEVEDKIPDISILAATLVSNTKSMKLKMKFLISLI